MIDQITPEQLQQLMATQSPTLVDVREVHEFRAGHVPGAINIPLGLLPVRLHELPRDAELTIICQSGNRSMQACMWLANQGRRSVNVLGGTGMWIREGKPVEAGVPA
ncbi:MAG TPA: rhodanese-like domain-containing protein [Candidatus Limnocylindrales bacterium]|nr:rhodanese-like domain-containing protein [Candidatus Limnocylindrales bacterium]